MPLSKRGIAEAQAAGESLQSVPVDVIFTSDLERAMETALIAMADHGSGRVPYIVHEGVGASGTWCHPPAEQGGQLIPVLKSEALNERMYGELQGLNKDAARAKFGEDQVHRWRRSFDEAPPGGESLKMTAARTLPFFKSHILPYLEKQQNVLVVAHGNSLRSIIMEIEGMTPEQILHFELPTGLPRHYEFRQGQFVHLQQAGGTA